MSLTYLKGIRTKTRKKVEAAIASASSATDSAKAADQSCDVARLLLELDVQNDLWETVLLKCESSLENFPWLLLRLLTKTPSRRKRQGCLPPWISAVTPMRCFYKWHRRGLIWVVLKPQPKAQTPVQIPRLTPFYETYWIA